MTTTHPIMSAPIPVFDLHCDLLSYLAFSPNARADDPTGMGATLPNLQQGNVRLQVLAIYSAVEEGSTKKALEQAQAYKQLLANHSQQVVAATDLATVVGLPGGDKTGLVVAIENASGFCEENDPLDKGFEKLERLIGEVDRLLYIGITHHMENRFGGGNKSQAGLKPDGEVLLQWLHGRRIAVDFSHTSDALAHDILNYTDKYSLEIPIIASHSNFRTLCNSPRNLPEELWREVVRRKGLIGMNFLRAYVHPTDPDMLWEHFMHGITNGAAEAIAFGADYFDVATLPDPERVPYFFSAHETAACNPEVMEGLAQRGLSVNDLEHVAYRNVLNFISRTW